MTMEPGRKTSPIVGVVYAARLYGSGEFRYVGITSRTVEFRRRQHIKAARGGRKTPFYDWLRKMESDEDIYFQPVELITNGSLEDLGEAEQRWIAKLRRKGHRLLNLTEGGLGPRGYVWTEEQRRAAGERSRGRKRENVPTGPDHPSWGTTRSDELKEHWSRTRKGMNSGAANPNFGKFGPAHPSYGHRMSDEARLELSEMRRGENNPNYGKSASVETRARMSAVRKGRAMPSSRRSAHTRHHTNKGVFKDTCQHCIDDIHAIHSEKNKEEE
ncbi:NUMOD3 domain-containing DNA-binding protein [Microbacterium sp. NPDC077391]|uniref:NUMOD3 domain-containing DNA-binding protein n=1 Tax=Microbacterium sp. NPDC077391 TaxID=3154765 RepID=UPI003449D119